MADQFLLDQITEAEEMILLVNSAIRSLLISKHQSYELDTGQTRQGVVRLNLRDLKQLRSGLIIEREDLRSACGLNLSVLTVVPY